MEELEVFLMSIANGETSFYQNQGNAQGYHQGMALSSSSSSFPSSAIAGSGGGVGGSMGLLVDKEAAKQLQHCITVLTVEEVGWIDGWIDGLIDDSPHSLIAVS